MTRTGKFRLPSLRQVYGKCALIISGALLFFTVATGLAWSNEIQVTASVDKQELTLEDSVILSIRVEGTRSAPVPQLPPLTGFTIQSRGSSSAIQIINGHKTSSFTHNVVLSPKETGALTIGPAEVTLAGKTYRTEPITLKVHPPSATVDTTRKVFAQLTVSNSKPYVHEQITATLKIFHRVEVKNLSLSIQFPGFREEKLGTPSQTVQVLNGVRYGVYEIHTALFPLSPGKLEIPSGQLDLDQVDRADRRRRSPFDPFGHGSPFDLSGSLQHKTLRTLPVPIEVQQLPLKNRPADFSNLVGEFYIDQKLSRKEIEVGDTVTLNITITGQGNIKDLSLKAPEGGEDFKVYEDQPEYRQIPGAELISGEKVYSYALVPLRAGKLTVPSVAWSYFDPNKHDYVSLHTQPLTLTAQPSTGNSGLKVVESDADPVGTAKGIQQLGEDILPIHTGNQLYENHTLSREYAWLYALGMVTPAGLFLFYRRFFNRRQRLKYDIAFSRSHGACKQALQQLDALSREGKEHEIVRELSSIVREYLGNILNLRGAAITSVEVEDKLKGNHFNAADIEATRKLLEKFETLQYASSPKEPPKELIQESRSLLKRLEKTS